MYVARFARFALMAASMAVYMEQANGGEGGSGGGGGGASTPPASTGQAQTFSAEYVRELREENRSWREKYQTLKGENATLKEAAEKASKDADGKVTAAEKAANDRILRSELKAHAVKAGLVDLDALKLADLSKVKLNDQGEVEGAEDLFKGLKEAKPYLFGQASTSTPATPPASTPPAATNAKTITDPGQYAASKSQFLAQFGS